MSNKHNYSQYSVKKKNNKPAPVNTAPEVKMEVKPVLMEETVDTVTLPKTVEGVVVDCAKLNVRAEPSINADIVCVLDVTSEIEINVDQSNDEWFKICTAIGAEGYCMRKFVKAYM